MKKVVELKNDYRKVFNRIKENENKIEELSLMYERRAAVQEKDIKRYNELHAAFKENENTITALSEKIYIDKIVLKIIDENTKAAAVDETIPVLKEVLKKYDGKPYGEKTRDRIRKELKELTGFYISFDGEKITIYNAATAYNNDALMYTGYNTPVITKENKINAAALDNITNRYTYAEKPATAAKKLIKLYNQARAALDTFENALKDYNAAAPEGLYKRPTNGYLYKTII